MNLPERTMVIQELEIETLPLHMQDEIIGEVGQNILMHVLLAILQKLPDDAAEAFRTLTEEARGAEAEAIAAQFIPDLDVFVAEESQKALAEFKRLRDLAA